MTVEQAKGRVMAAKKPNILILWGDDIGYWNISAYNLGQMGYRTPNLDRLAKEGALFTDWYGQQSCTAGRACFITGQSGFRTGMLKVGLPGAKEGLQARFRRTVASRSRRVGDIGRSRLCTDRFDVCPRVASAERAWRYPHEPFESTAE
jgi:hypothetical protein